MEKEGAKGREKRKKERKGGKKKERKKERKGDRRRERRRERKREIKGERRRERRKGFISNFKPQNHYSNLLFRFLNYTTTYEPPEHLQKQVSASFRETLPSRTEKSPMQPAESHVPTEDQF